MAGEKHPGALWDRNTYVRVLGGALGEHSQGAFGTLGSMEASGEVLGGAWKKAVGGNLRELWEDLWEEHRGILGGALGNIRGRSGKTLGNSGRELGGARGSITEKHWGDLFKQHLEELRGALGGAMRGAVGGALFRQFSST